MQLLKVTGEESMHIYIHPSVMVSMTLPETVELIVMKSFLSYGYF